MTDILTREQIEKAMGETDNQIQSGSLQRAQARQVILNHDAALRAEVELLKRELVRHNEETAKEVGELRAERDRLANPLEHADYFAPQIIVLQRDKERLQGRVDGLRARLCKRVNDAQAQIPRELQATLAAQGDSLPEQIMKLRQEFELAQVRVKELEQRERGYLSELQDYATTVANLRLRVKAVDVEHAEMEQQKQVSREAFQTLEQQLATVTERLRWALDGLIKRCDGFVPPQAVAWRKELGA